MGDKRGNLSDVYFLGHDIIKFGPKTSKSANEEKTKQTQLCGQVLGELLAYLEMSLAEFRGFPSLARFEALREAKLIKLSEFKVKQKLPVETWLTRIKDARKGIFPKVFDYVLPPVHAHLLASGLGGQ